MASKKIHPNIVDFSVKAGTMLGINSHELCLEILRLRLLANALYLGSATDIYNQQKLDVEAFMKKLKTTNKLGGEHGLHTLAKIAIQPNKTEAGRLWKKCNQDYSFTIRQMQKTPTDNIKNAESKRESVKQFYACILREIQEMLLTSTNTRMKRHMPKPRESAVDHYKGLCKNANKSLTITAPNLKQPYKKAS